MSANFEIETREGSIRVTDERSWQPIVRIYPKVNPNAYGWIDLSSDDARALAAMLVVQADVADRLAAEVSP